MSLDQMFSNTGASHLLAMLRDEDIAQITVNAFDRVTFESRTEGRSTIHEALFGNTRQYCDFLNDLLRYTDHPPVDFNAPNTAVVEASLQRQHGLRGSIHVVTSLCTGNAQPALTVRKQPIEPVSLDEMVHEQYMMSTDMADFLKRAMQGRLNILVSGGSGAGKTTLARALSVYISPHHRVCTVEDIDELHLGEWLPETVSMLTHRQKNSQGAVVWEVDQEALVKEALRMRPDRIWVGEVRGREAYALTKAALSGHDGSLTTIHSDNGQQAVKQLVSYVMEYEGMTTSLAEKQVARAFDLVVQVQRVRPDRRAITEITQLEPVHEGGEQRTNTLWSYDPVADQFLLEGQVAGRKLREKFLRNGVNIDQVT